MFVKANKVIKIKKLKIKQCSSSGWSLNALSSIKLLDGSGCFSISLLLKTT